MNIKHERLVRALAFLHTYYCHFCKDQLFLTLRGLEKHEAKLHWEKVAWKEKFGKRFRRR